MGNLDQNIIARIAARADLNLAILSGRSLVEAGLGGAPTICYDVDWHSELISNGKTGFVVRNLDYGSMARCIELIYTDANLKASIRNNIRKASIRLCNEEILAQQQESYYRKLVENKYKNVK